MASTVARSWRPRSGCLRSRVRPVGAESSSWTEASVSAFEGASFSRAPAVPTRASSLTDGRSARQLGAELAESVHVPADVVVRVLHADRPLLLVAGRHEDAAVHHPRER